MTVKLFTCVLAVVLLSGCGQKGPLYLPDQPAPIHVQKDDNKKQ